MVDRLAEFLAGNPPSGIPFFPGARVTEWFGLRQGMAAISLGASPLHLGIDRAGGDRLRMPFDGEAYWRLVDGSAGSLLRLRPDDAPFEVQVFHTEGPQRATELRTRLQKGDVLPVSVGSLGIGTGPHTHTEVLFPYRAELIEWIDDTEPWLVSDGYPHEREIESQCSRYGLPHDATLAAVRRQVTTWRIREMRGVYAIREALPSYRIPRWSGATVLVDSQWLFRI
jgi:hypothetical protein